MGNVPFTVYDALGYLSAGAILMVAFTIAMLGELPTEVTLVAGIAIGIAAYVIGHVIASISGWWLDRALFSDGLGMGRPEKVLFGEPVDSFPWKSVFRNYYQSLPDPIRDRVLEKARSEGVVSGKEKGYPEGLLEHCEAVVQNDQSFGPRADRYEMLTTFLRNTSSAFVGAAVILALAPTSNGINLETASGGTATLHTRMLAALSMVAAVVLLFRYVQLFAEWRRRIFVLYAETE